MAAILNSAILDSTILHKKNFTHSFWLNLMMAAILKSAMLDSDTAILDSDILLSFLRFTQKYSHSTLTLTQTNSIWLKLIQSDLTWWWQHSPSWIQPFCTKKLWLKLISFSLNLMMAAILNSAILDSAILHKKNFTCIHSDSTWWWQPSWTLPSWIQPFCTKKTSLIHSDSTWWWQPSWSLPCWIQTLPSWIQTPFYLLSDSIKNTLTPFWLWLKLIQSDSNSLILT